MRGLSVLGLLVAFGFGSANAQLAYKGFNVHVSDSFRTIEMNKTLSCPSADGAILQGTDYYDEFVVDVKSTTSGHLTIFDESDVRLNKQPLKPLKDQVLRGQQRFTIDTKQLKKDVFAFIDCRNTTGTVQIRIVRNGLRLGVAKGLGILTLTQLIDKIEPLYRWPNITLTLAPCGSVNAMSSPDILLCTELVGDLLHKDQGRALFPILLHELGHSTLKLWGFPGYDNEDMADEFATYILSLTTDGPESIDEFIRWLEAHDPVSEAVAQIVLGSRHTISLQRARNIRAAASRPHDIQARWKKMLKAHEK